MNFPFELKCEIREVPGAATSSITVYGGLTTLVGPNGSGKTQVLRALKSAVRPLVAQGKVHFLSAGRSAPVEQYRSDWDGSRGDSLNYDEAAFGGRKLRDRRHLSEAVTGDFHTLSFRADLQIKIAERLRRLFNRDVLLDWDEGRLRVRFVRLDSSHPPYSVAREASGLLQLVVLLAALYDDEVAALLIDEPEVSLHPQLQAFLLREIREVAGDPSTPGKKLVFIATHSTEMIDIRRPEDVASIVFCCDPDRPPIQVSPERPELKNAQLRALLPHLSHAHKLAFFCARPLLVEGPSDAFICTELDNRLSLYLAPTGAQLVPVMGKGRMPIVAKLLKLIGKSPIVLADVDAIADGLDLVSVYASDSSVAKAANAKGYSDAHAFAASVHGDFCHLADAQWHDIAPHAEQHPYWQLRDPTKNEVAQKRRAALAALMSMSAAERASMSNTVQWVAIYDRVTALLDFLETAGCFVFRRGTIECYYGTVDARTAAGKPGEALVEATTFAQADSALLEAQYADALRALRFAARVQSIDEREALRELLLAVSAPALAVLCKDTTPEQLNQLALRLLSDKASLLRLEPSAGDSGQPRLTIHLNSAVLPSTGFPIRLDKGCNPVTEVDRQLGIDSSDGV
ncbi:MAG TPA: AAA family ATPase [Armatimonadota bacterium]|nr:AAA family ATPase [Armatimonadota bacterium]